MKGKRKTFAKESQMEHVFIEPVLVTRARCIAEESVGMEEALVRFLIKTGR